MVEILIHNVSAQRADGSSYHVPYWDIRTPEPGPRVLVTAAFHGNEIQGAEVLRRFVRDHGASVERGSCCLVPFANPVACALRQPHIDFELGRYYGSDRENNVNCTWPGNADGTNAQRLSHALFNALVPDATHNLDLHCWQASRAATALARSDNAGSMQLAEASTLPFVQARPGHAKPGEGPTFPCTLTTYFNDSGRTAVAIEFSGQYTVDPAQINIGLRAIRNCLRVLDMLPGDRESGDRDQIRLDQTHEVRVSTPCSGLFVKAPGVALGDDIGAGILLGHVLDTKTLETTDIKAPADGSLFQYGLAHEERKGAEHEQQYFHPYMNAEETVAILAAPAKETK